jgi:hypothetical protein
MILCATTKIGLPKAHPTKNNFPSPLLPETYLCLAANLPRSSHMVSPSSIPNTTSQNLLSSFRFSPCGAPHLTPLAAAPHLTMSPVSRPHPPLHASFFLSRCFIIPVTGLLLLGFLRVPSVASHHSLPLAGYGGGTCRRSALSAVV